MKKQTRSHERSPDKAQTSIAIPRTMLERIQDLADSETRTRNNMIEVLLREALRNKDISLVAESEDEEPYG